MTGLCWMRLVARWAGIRLLAPFALSLAVIVAASPSARAETVTGTFTYLDTRVGGKTVERPIRGADVEIWQKGPGGIFWGPTQTVRTDDNGKFTTTVPWKGAGTTQTSLRIYAKNRAADVRTKDLYAWTFYQQPGPPGTTVVRESNSPSEELEFEHTFDDPGAVMYYNVADVILRGMEYAEARRDPRESDAIGPTAVYLMSSVNSFYNGAHVIHLDDDIAMIDVAVLHEYAHLLENDLSSFQPWGADHDGCTTAWDAPRYAWMEGFADYFGQVVTLMMPGLEFDAILAPETPSCPPGSAPLKDLEKFVASALWDLVDSPTTLRSIPEPRDRQCNGQHIGVPNDVRIFQILDHELEIGPNNPRLEDFSKAWIRRGYDVPYAAFDAISAGLPSPTPVTARYDFDTRTWNKAIWRPSTAEWWVRDSYQPNVDSWGQPGDIPVPADYDGDGITDIGIWRPGDGSWWVIHSSSNKTPPIVQWGASTDIPVPGDYDGDSEDDFAVYRFSTGTLHVFSDSCAAETVYSTPVGQGTPLVGDFDNDGRDELALYLSDGTFTVRPSGGGPTISAWLGPTVHFGASIIWVIPSKPVVGDFDGDRRADVGRFEYGTTWWRIWNSSTGMVTSVAFGNVSDIAVPGDYDGDGTTDLATWTPDLSGSGLSFFNVMGEGSSQWGGPGDIPVPAP